MPGCLRCHLRPNAPVRELEDNIQRYLNSPVMVDTVHAQHRPFFFHDRVSMAFPAPTVITSLSSVASALSFNPA